MLLSSDHGVVVYTVDFWTVYEMSQSMIQPTENSDQQRHDLRSLIESSLCTLRIAKASLCQGFFMWTVKTDQTG